jgi:hypothetical protein
MRYKTVLKLGDYFLKIKTFTKQKLALTFSRTMDTNQETITAMSLHGAISTLSSLVEIYLAQ